MSEQCGFCGAVYWKEEKNTAHKYTKCCHDGKVQLPAFPDAPELIESKLKIHLMLKIIDSEFGNTEGSCLHFLRQNQEDLRIELYRGLLDALECRAHNENIRTGKLIILPSSFQGSPRHMQQNYQDAMAMVRKFGKPDLFLTFTCNTSWSEILNSMEGVQRPEDRPDIIVRVFNQSIYLVNFLLLFQIGWLNVI
ncbi:hypothetical protein AVEN_55434-1 [Araneus ventricosus]|uniref:Helitron helicase-like domain-containing protein n=1 Tax=Araneus ventricosus TaxID=182803 RepID=A0A4Y2WLK3_ARAVE|nr:hypothetical protein AVEN_55434-1 [Araneus ventricosus]